jgi:hypothetical protein
MKKWFFFGSLVLLLPPVVSLIDRAGIIYWVGGTNLLVEFIVSDDETGAPIKGAEIRVFSEGGLYHEANKQDEVFTLTTDANGIARRVCEESLCFGTQSTFRLTDTYHVHLPWWRVKASAPSYAPSNAWIEIDTPENHRVVEHAGRNSDRLIVPLTLKKQSP